MVKFNIINKATSLALDGHSVSQKCTVLQWNLHNDVNQHWQVETVDGGVKLICQNSFCLAVAPNERGTVVSGSSVVLDLTSDSSFQVWSVVETEPGWYAIGFTNPNDGEVFALCGQPSGRNGETIRVRPFVRGSDFQAWRLSVTTPGQFPFLTRNEFSAISVSATDFFADPQKAAKILSAEGFIVFTDVLTGAELTEASASFGRDLLKVCDWDVIQATSSSLLGEAAEQLSSCGEANVPRLWPGKYSLPSLSSSHGIPQGEFAWTMRLNPTIRRIYATLHSTQSHDLVVGMDTPFFKPMHSDYQTQTNFWGHADLNLCHNAKGVPEGVDISDWVIYQSILSIWASDTQEDSTTVIWPKSNVEIFPELMKFASGCPPIGQFVPIDGMRSGGDRNGAWINERYLREARRIPLPEGSLLVWNSRTVHQGWSEGRRLAMPICWEPRNRRSQKALARKIRICASGSVTTHWASLGNEHSLPRRNGKGQMKLEDAISWEDIEMPCKDWCDPLYCYKSPTEEDTAAVTPVDRNHVRNLCKQLAQESDENDEILQQLENCIRTDILAVL